MREPPPESTNEASGGESPTAAAPETVEPLSEENDGRDKIRWLNEPDEQGARHVLDSRYEGVNIIGPDKFFLHDAIVTRVGAVVTPRAHQVCTVDFEAHKGCPNGGGTLWDHPYIVDLKKAEKSRWIGRGRMCGGDALRVCTQSSHAYWRRQPRGAGRTELRVKTFLNDIGGKAERRLPYTGRRLESGIMVYPDLFTQFAQGPVEQKQKIIHLRLDRSNTTTVWKQGHVAWTVDRSTRTVLVLDVHGVLWRARIRRPPVRLGQVYSPLTPRARRREMAFKACATEVAFYVVVGDISISEDVVFRYPLEPDAKSREIFVAQDGITSLDCAEDGDLVAWVAEQRYVEGKGRGFHLVISDPDAEPAPE